MNNETADNISVFLRFCPINDLEAISESCVQILDEETRVKLNLSTSSNKDEVDCDFTFDKVSFCTGYHMQIGEKELLRSLVIYVERREHGVFHRDIRN